MGSFFIISLQPVNGVSMIFMTVGGCDTLHHILSMCVALAYYSVYVHYAVMAVHIGVLVPRKMCLQNVTILS